MSFIHSSGFAYVKNLIIGCGAAVVLVGALFKIQSWPYASEMLTVGLITEACLFLMLGVLPPHKDYYWEQLYPGLDKAGADMSAFLPDNVDAVNSPSKVDQNAALIEAVNGMKTAVSPLESQQTKMVSELQTMSKTMKSLDIFAGLDFDDVGKLTKETGKFVTVLSNAIQNVADSAEDVNVYREELKTLNGNLSDMNKVYGGVVNAMEGVAAVADSADSIKEYSANVKTLNANLASINKVYGGMLSAMKG
ncbi:type IX secretion system motor protein PorL/GldL [Aureispira anguillae]|uniref:Gliding motility protein GldL n=1 Tax=Aureispira anguillae TaxID=2864201 RepID=A0A915YIY1_9BACT|nr:gliding motility protein GldL [Aureispira anguillae]BDS13905.1 gliding motility protein GldL [Aureispira anguillae]